METFFRPRSAGPMAALAFALALALAAPSSAFATLGSDQASIEADRTAMAGTASAVVNAAGYTVQSFTLPSGTVIREYLASGGTVFAVAWEGPFKPDLRQLLGARQFTALDDSTREHNLEGRRGPLSLRPAGAGKLRVESSGHMRAFAGRAWLSDQLPTGVDADAIR